MILNAVNQLRRVLQTASYSKSLGLYAEPGLSKVTVHVTSAMPSCKYYRPHKGKLCSRMCGVDAYHAVALQNETGHQSLKMNLTAAIYYGIPDILNNTWQAVCTDMWMSIG